MAELISLVRQFEFYRFLMVIDHIGRSKKTFICTCILLCILLTVGQIDGPPIWTQCLPEPALLVLELHSTVHLSD